VAPTERAAEEPWEMVVATGGTPMTGGTLTVTVIVGLSKEPTEFVMRTQ
jgi:hypothetical protein